MSHPVNPQPGHQGLPIPSSCLSMRMRQLALATVVAFGLGGPAAWAQADDYSEVNRLVRAGQLNEAMYKADQYLAGKPRDPQMRFLKGVIQTESGKTTDAIATFAKLTEDYPELPEPYNNLAVLYAGQSQFDKARAALEMAIRTNPSYATAHENLGDIYAALANAAYNRAIVLDKGNNDIESKQELVARITGMQKTTAPVQVSSSARPSAATPRPAPPAPVRTQPTPAPAVATRPAAPARTPARQAVPDINDVPDTFSTTPILPGGAAVASNSGKLSSADEKAVLARLESWRASWSAQNVDQYLANYSPNFDPATGVSRSVWESQRRTRVVRPRSIAIQVLSPRVGQTSGNRAWVEFTQIYESNSYSDQVRKRLEMENVGGQWLIVKESVVG